MPPSKGAEPERSPVLGVFCYVYTPSPTLQHRTITFGKVTHVGRAFLLVSHALDPKRVRPHGLQNFSSSPASPRARVTKFDVVNSYEVRVITVSDTPLLIAQCVARFVSDSCISCINTVFSCSRCGVRNHIQRVRYSCAAIY